MKFLCIILSLYVVLLSVRPCCDDACAGEITSSKTNANKAANTDCGTCSPFYRCGTCTGFVALAQVIPVLAIPAANLVGYTVYRQPTIQDVSRAIWQPPQLS